jgi:hypothetical protein
MLTIVWNPNGFHVIDVLPKGIKFNADHYITDAFIPWAEWRKTQVGRTDRNLIVHGDNAGLHTAETSLDFLEQNGMRKALHPPYSRDPAASDFYLFGHVKQFLAEHKFTNQSALLDGVQNILRGIEEVTLDQVFLAWMERLE